MKKAILAILISFCFMPILAGPLELNDTSFAEFQKQFKTKATFACEDGSSIVYGEDLHKGAYVVKIAQDTIVNNFYFFQLHMKVNGYIDLRPYKKGILFFGHKYGLRHLPPCPQDPAVICIDLTTGNPDTLYENRTSDSYWRGLAWANVSTFKKFFAQIKNSSTEQQAEFTDYKLYENTFTLTGNYYEAPIQSIIWLMIFKGVKQPRFKATFSASFTRTGEYIEDSFVMNPVPEEKKKFFNFFK